MPVVALILLVLLSGCGYRVVGPEAETASFGRIGRIDDLTPSGDLGLRAVERLRPRMAELAGAGTIVGVIRPHDALAGPQAAHGQVARVAGVEVELTLRGADGAILARSGPVRRTRPALLGPTVFEATAGYTRAVRQALDLAVDEAFARLLPDRADGGSR